MQKFIISLLCVIFSSSSLIAQQPSKPSASEIYQELEKLNFLGTALYIAAHPDDEGRYRADTVKESKRQYHGGLVSL